MAIYIDSENIRVSQKKPSIDQFNKYLFEKQKHYLNYVDHGVSPEISSDLNTGRISINRVRETPEQIIELIKQQEQA